MGCRHGADSSSLSWLRAGRRRVCCRERKMVVLTRETAADKGKKRGGGAIYEAVQGSKEGGREGGRYQASSRGDPGWRSGRPGENARDP